MSRTQRHEPTDEPEKEIAPPVDERHELHAALQAADGPQPSIESRRARRSRENDHAE
jgi:hypothetical protein